MAARKAKHRAATITPMKTFMIIESMQVRSVSMRGADVHYCVKDIGAILGFGGGAGGGGNLTRDIRGKYKGVFTENRDYVVVAKAIYMPPGAIYALLGLVMQDQPRRSTRVHAFIRHFAPAAYRVDS